MKYKEIYAYIFKIRSKQRDISKPFFRSHYKLPKFGNAGAKCEFAHDIPYMKQHCTIFYKMYFLNSTITRRSYIASAEL